MEQLELMLSVYFHMASISFPFPSPQFLPSSSLLAICSSIPVLIVDAALGDALLVAQKPWQQQQPAKIIQVFEVNLMCKSYCHLGSHLDGTALFSPQNLLTCCTAALSTSDASLPSSFAAFF